MTIMRLGSKGQDNLLHGYVWLLRHKMNYFRNNYKGQNNVLQQMFSPLRPSKMYECNRLGCARSSTNYDVNNFGS